MELGSSERPFGSLPVRSPALRGSPWHFPTTRWSLVLRAREPGGGRALDELCRAYWSPVNSFIRGFGLSKEDAEDVTQAFLARFVAGSGFARVERARGRFRSWLRACARNHVLNWLDSRNAISNGGQAAHVRWEELENELKDERTADRVFDRHWALTVLQRALDRLHQRYEASGKQDVFTHLHGSLAGWPSALDDQQLAVLLATSPGYVRVLRCHIKKAFQECLREEVAETVADAGDVEDELRRLSDALAE